MYAYIKPKDAKKFIWALTRLEDNLDRQAHSELPRKMAYEFRPILIDNINQQKFAGGYNRYNRKYQDWKQRTVRHLRFWILMGDLVKHIKVLPLSSIGNVPPPAMSARRSGAYLGGPKSRPYMVGIPADAMDKGGKSWLGEPSEGDPKGPPKSIAMYARILEFGGDYSAEGGGTHPARPAFGPSMLGYKRREGLETCGRVLRQIGRWSWRG